MVDDGLAAITDWIAIRRVTAEYVCAVDERNPEALAATFTPDGVIEVVGMRTHSGREEVAKVALRDRGTALHMTTDPIIDVDGDRATQTCRLLIARASGDERTPVTFYEAGTYDDELVRAGDGWLFARRTVNLLRDA
ncbi:MAG TPA: nuclear transport factor 2 family protein [Solirubrobacterales bacterium]